MRRSSIITIILLVLVIIGLTVALVMTNLPKNNVDDSISTENNEAQDDGKSESPKPEEPKQVDLNSDIAKDMATIIHPYGFADLFYNTKTGMITQKDFTDKEKIYIAYYLFAGKNKVDSDKKEYYKMISKSDMDNAIYKIFGNTDYKPIDVSLMFLNLKYDNETERFYELQGGGGGGPTTYIVTGVYNIEEYLNRYEVYSKYLVINLNSSDLTTSSGSRTGNIWRITDRLTYPARVSDRMQLAEFRDFEAPSDNTYLQSIVSEEELLSNIQLKPFAKINTNFNTENDEKFLSKYFDQATEYKHTFMKNEDGSYYWVKSEIIK